MRSGPASKQRPIIKRGPSSPPTVTHKKVHFQSPPPTSLPQVTFTISENSTTRQLLQASIAHIRDHPHLHKALDQIPASTLRSIGIAKKPISSTTVTPPFVDLTAQQQTSQDPLPDSNTSSLSPVPTSPDPPPTVSPLLPTSHAPPGVPLPRDTGACRSCVSPVVSSTASLYSSPAPSTSPVLSSQTTRPSAFQPPSSSRATPIPDTPHVLTLPSDYTLRSPSIPYIPERFVCTPFTHSKQFLLQYYKCCPHMFLLSAIDYSIQCLTCTNRTDTPNMRTLFTAHEDGFIRTHVLNLHTTKCVICQSHEFSSVGPDSLQSVFAHVTACKLRVHPLLARPYVCEHCHQTLWVSTD